MILDIGKDDKVNVQPVQAMADDLVANIPPQLLGLVKSRVFDLEKSIEEKKKENIESDQLFISIHFKEDVKPIIAFNINSDQIEESRSLACFLSNEMTTLFTVVPMAPVNLDFVDQSNQAQLLDKESVAVQIYLPQKLTFLERSWDFTDEDNQNKLVESFWKGVLSYYALSEVKE